MKNYLLHFCYGIFTFICWVLFLWVGTMINVFQYLPSHFDIGTFVGAFLFLGTILGLSFSTIILCFFPVGVCFWFQLSPLKYNLIDRKECKQQL